MSRGLPPQVPPTASWVQAFEEALRAIHPQVFAFVFRRLRDREESEEICQELYAEFWEKYRAWQWDGDVGVRHLQLYARLTRLARYRVVDWRRRQGVARGPGGAS